MEDRVAIVVLIDDDVDSVFLTHKEVATADNMARLREHVKAHKYKNHVESIRLVRVSTDSLDQYENVLNELDNVLQNC